MRRLRRRHFLRVARTPEEPTAMDKEPESSFRPDVAHSGGYTLRFGAIYLRGGPCACERVGTGARGVFWHRIGGGVSVAPFALGLRCRFHKLQSEILPTLPWGCAAWHMKEDSFILVRSAWFLARSNGLYSLGGVLATTHVAWGYIPGEELWRSAVSGARSPAFRAD